MVCQSQEIFHWIPFSLKYTLQSMFWMELIINGTKTMYRALCWGNRSTIFSSKFHRIPLMALELCFLVKRFAYLRNWPNIAQLVSHMKDVEKLNFPNKATKATKLWREMDNCWLVDKKDYCCLNCCKQTMIAWYA